jgi:hypothetical protein
MKSFWILFLIVVMTASSLSVRRPDVIEKAQTTTERTFEQVPEWDSDVLTRDSQKHSEKTVQIAQDFIPIVVIADEIDSEQNYSHYLPLYRLHRLKDYFLLI